MSELAWVGRKKACGCPTFARLCSASNKRFPNGLNVSKVPVSDATLVLCGCK